MMSVDEEVEKLKPSNSLAVPYTIKCREVPNGLGYLLLVIYKIIKNIHLKKNLYINVHSSITRNLHNNRPLCPSTDKWINKCGISIQWSIIHT